MYFTYIIYSKNRDRYYVGHCENITKRLEDHNNSRSPYTKTGKPWILKWKKQLPSRSEATKEERRIKARKSRKYIEWLIEQETAGSPAGALAKAGFLFKVPIISHWFQIKSLAPWPGWIPFTEKA